MVGTYQRKTALVEAQEKAKDAAYKRLHPQRLQLGNFTLSRFSFAERTSGGWRASQAGAARGSE
jgi:hypothetical protein